MSTHQLEPGAIFAGYTIERLIGIGGMGSVYLARHPDLPRSEALKVLSPELSRDPGFRARFVREAEVAAALEHPNIVAIHQRGEFDGQLWIAMQYIAGTDADQALAAGTMTPERAVRIIAEVGKALDYAHKKNVVHRDVKPANFLLSPSADESDERVLLADFGIARALGDAGLTSTGAVMATLSYAAPEVLTGGSFDGRADIYSLGCSLYRLLTGQSPYATADGAAAIMYAHLQQPPPTVSNLVPGLSSRMDWVIGTAMAKDPNQRFGSAREFAELAAQALADTYGPTTQLPVQPVPAPTQQAYLQPSGPQQTYPQPSGPQQTWPHTAPTTAYYPGPAAPPPPRRSRRAILIGTAVLAVILAGVGTTLALRSGSSNSSTTGSTSGYSSASPTSEPDPTHLVANADMPKLLPTAEQVSELIGMPLTVSRTLNSLIDDSSTTIPEADRNCIGALMPGQRQVYLNTEYKGFLEQFLVPKEGVGAYVMQGVVTYGSAAAAQKVMDQQRTTWPGCQDRQFIMNAPGAPTVTLTTKSISNPETDLMSLTNVQSSAANPAAGNILTCQRAMALRNNVIIDVLACRIDAADQGVELAKTIRSNVDAAR